ncbi:hypothetical protein OROGR_022714 [Orobanche gracilis]
MKSKELVIIINEEQENELPDFPSFIPFFPPLFFSCCGNHAFWWTTSTVLELRLGLGGTSYGDFIHSMHLPMQLSQVDPIVATFSGGAVGVISALMVVEINNVKLLEHKRCKYCVCTVLSCLCSLFEQWVCCSYSTGVDNECRRSASVAAENRKMFELFGIRKGHVPYVSLHGNGYGERARSEIRSL